MAAPNIFSSLLQGLQAGQARQTDIHAQLAQQAMQKVNQQMEQQRIALEKSGQEATEANRARQAKADADAEKERIAEWNRTFQANADKEAKTLQLAQDKLAQEAKETGEAAKAALQERRDKMVDGFVLAGETPERAEILADNIVFKKPTPQAQLAHLLPAMFRTLGLDKVTPDEMAFRKSLHDPALEILAKPATAIQNMQQKTKNLEAIAQNQVSINNLNKAKEANENARTKEVIAKTKAAELLLPLDMALKRSQTDLDNAKTAGEKQHTKDYHEMMQAKIKEVTNEINAVSADDLAELERLSNDPKGWYAAHRAQSSTLRGKLRSQFDKVSGTVKTLEAASVKLKKDANEADRRASHLDAMIDAAKKSEHLEYVEGGKVYPLQDLENWRDSISRNADIITKQITDNTALLQPALRNQQDVQVPLEKLEDQMRAAGALKTAKYTEGNKIPPFNPNTREYHGPPGFGPGQHSNQPVVHGPHKGASKPSNRVQTAPKRIHLKWDDLK